MVFKRIGDVRFDVADPAPVYAEGWQSWSPVRSYRLGETTAPATSEREQKVALRPDKPIPPGVIQAEGLLVVGSEAWFAPHPEREVPTLRIGVEGERAIVSADGEVEWLRTDGSETALAAVGRKLQARALSPVPPGWSSWSCYFKRVTEADVVENADAAVRLGLPVQIVQVDDGYERSVGDWLDIDPRFGSLQGTAGAIRSAGMRPGLWVAPFMVDPRSRLAATHPDWLLPDIDAGSHWGVAMRILDVGHLAAAGYLREVFATFRGWGFDFFKLDFLYAGAMQGLGAYREGMSIIRDAIGSQATVLACGAPLLPSIGLCDAMRVGPDVLPEEPDPQPDVETLTRITSSRRWMNGLLWTNDPDHLVARAGIKDRQRWAEYVGAYGGVKFSSDRLSTLDARGLEMTRRVLTGP